MPLFDQATITDGPVYRPRRELNSMPYSRGDGKQSPEYGAAYGRLRKYGITHPQYEAMLAEQFNRCAICEETFTGDGHMRASVDHDHSSGAIRGLLCVGCNTGLGNLGDNPEILMRAATYLTRHAGKPGMTS